MGTGKERYSRAGYTEGRVSLSEWVLEGEREREQRRAISDKRTTKPPSLPQSELAALLKLHNCDFVTPWEISWREVELQVLVQQRTNSKLKCGQ